MLLMQMMQRLNFASNHIYFQTGHTVRVNGGVRRGKPPAAAVSHLVKSVCAITM